MLIFGSVVTAPPSILPKVVTPRATSSFFDGLLLEFHDGVVPEAALRTHHVLGGA